MEINMVIPVVDLKRATQIFSKAFSLVIIKEAGEESYMQKVLLGTDPDHPAFWLEQVQDLKNVNKRQLQEALQPYLRIKTHDVTEYDMARKAIYLDPTELSERETMFADLSTYLKEIKFKFRVSPPDEYMFTPTY